MTKGKDQTEQKRKTMVNIEGAQVSRKGLSGNNLRQRGNNQIPGERTAE